MCMISMHVVRIVIIIAPLSPSSGIRRFQVFSSVFKCFQLSTFKQSPLLGDPIFSILAPKISRTARVARRHEMVAKINKFYEMLVILDPLV